MTSLHRLARSLTAPRFLRWVVLPHVAFFAVAWFTDAPPLIAVLNSIDIALSVAVCIAFLPSALDSIFNDRPADKAVFLTLGIFCGWEGNSLRSGWSMAWRALGMPEWFANTDITSYILFVIGAGALFHLLAPGALDEDVPPKRWIKIGAWIGAGVFLAIVLTYLHDVEGYIHGLAPSHDRAVAPAGFDDVRSRLHRRRSAPLPERVAGLFAFHRSGFFRPRGFGSGLGDAARHTGLEAPSNVSRPR